MFESSLVESTTLIQTRNRWPAVISTIAQSLLAASLIAIPLFHPEIVTTHASKLSFLAPPRVVPPPPPPVQLLHITTATTNAPSTSAPAQTTAPTRLLTTATTPDIAPTLNPLDIMPGTSPTAAFSLVPSANSGPTVVIATPTAAGTPTKPTGPMHLSTGVTAGHLFAPIQPIYPAIALASRTQGTVIVEAIISKSGQIESAHITSGPIMLQSAALAAVRGARYHPFLLNGQPTEVATTISINFHLGN